MQPVPVEEQRHQPEYPLELLFHRLVQRQENHVVLLELMAKRPEHLIRAVVAGDLRRQQELDELSVERNIRMRVVQLVQRGDDPVPQFDVRLEQAVDKDLLREWRADPDEDRRQLAFEVSRTVRIVQPLLDVRHDGIAVARERNRGGAGQIGTRKRIEQRGNELRSRWPRGAQDCLRATTGSSSSMRRVSRSAKPAGTTPSTRAA